MKYDVVRGCGSHPGVLGWLPVILGGVLWGMVEGAAATGPEYERLADALRIPLDQKHFVCERLKEMAACEGHRLVNPVFEETQWRWVEHAYRFFVVVENGQQRSMTRFETAVRLDPRRLKAADVQEGSTVWYVTLRCADAPCIQASIKESDVLGVKERTLGEMAWYFDDEADAERVKAVVDRLLQSK